MLLGHHFVIFATSASSILARSERLFVVQIHRLVLLGHLLQQTALLHAVRLGVAPLARPFHLWLRTFILLFLRVLVPNN